MNGSEEAVSFAAQVMVEDDFQTQVMHHCHPKLNIDASGFTAQIIMQWNTLVNEMHDTALQLLAIMFCR